MSTKLLGIIIMVIGVLMIVYTGFNYFTNDTVMQIGEMHINKQTSHPVQWSPIVGVVLLIGGIVLVAISKKQAI